MDIGPPPIDSGESQPQLKILSPTNELPPTSLISSMALNQTSPPADLAEDQINVAGTINGGFIDASGQDRSRNSVAAIGPISVNNGSGSDSNESATVASGGHLANTTCVSVPMGIHEQTIPGIGAWSKPLNFISNQSATTLLMQTTKDLLADLSSESQWPSLATASHSDQRRRQTTCAGTLRPPSSKDNAGPAAPRASVQYSLEQVKEYPWAAKMDKSKRNLHQVTTPVFLEDGTPKVCIPRHVLLEGLENQKEFVLGQFYRCSAPPNGLVQSVVNRIWGTKCRIYTRELENSSFLFHIPDEPTRKWVTQRGIWHVDDCILFVSAWNPAGTLALPEITTIPVWLTLKDIPHQLYSKKGISWIASGIGAPMLTSRPWLDPILMGEAKILVEVKLDRPFPQRVALEDEDGTVSMVTVIYSWLPSKCPKCGQLGHKATRCLGLPPVPVSKDLNTNESSESRPLQCLPVAGSKLQDVHSDPSPLTEASKSSVDISIDSQGCILLDQETNDLMPSNIPTKALVNNIGVNVESPLRHSALMETETIPLVSSQNSTCTIAPTSEVLYLSETALLSPIAGLNETFTTSTIVSSTLSTPLHFTAAGTPSLPASVVDLEPKLGGLGNNSKQLSDVKGSNRFANLALMEEELASDDISSPSHTLLPATVTTTPFVFNSPVPSSPSSLSDGLVSQVEKDDFGTSFVAATSNSSDMAQRSRVGRCLKPSQKLKDMEWFTIGKKGRRGRGSAAAGRLTH